MARFLILLAFLLAQPLSAQLVHWSLRPHYTSLRLSDTGDALVTDSAGVSTICDVQGRRLVTTTDRIMPLFDGIAASVSPNLTQVTGIYHSDGTFISLEKKGYGVALGYPYFVGEYLVVRQGKEGYNILDTHGRPKFKTPYPRIYPFSHGLVACQGFLNPKKQTGPCCLYYDEKFREVPLTYKGKRLPVENTQFLSTVSDDGRSVALVGGLFFWFDVQTRELTPIVSSQGEHVHLNVPFEKSYIPGSAGEPQVFNAVGAEGEQVVLKFDKQGYPYEIHYGATTESFLREPRVIKALPTSFQRIQDPETRLLGLVNLEGDTLLPPQFSEIPVLFDDNAIVRLGEGYGLLHFDPTAQLSVQLNKGDDMAFLHRTLDVPIRVDMPQFVSPTGVRILSQTRGMQVDQSSIQTRHNRNGSCAEFQCALSFPEGLSADSIAEISYPIQVVYEGLTSPVLYTSSHAWHYKYFDVRVPASEIEIRDGNVRFNFYIERTVQEQNYPFDVQVDAGGLTYHLDKISESYYQCQIERLKEGDNSIIVQVTEQGCPPVSCPVDVTYKKPVKAQSGTATRKTETVDIKVKQKSEEKPKHTKIIIPI